MHEKFRLSLRLKQSKLQSNRSRIIVVNTALLDPCSRECSVVTGLSCQVFQIWPWDTQTDRHWLRCISGVGCLRSKRLQLNSLSVLTSPPSKSRAVVIWRSTLILASISSSWSGNLRPDYQKLMMSSLCQKLSTWKFLPTSASHSCLSCIATALHTHTHSLTSICPLLVSAVVGRSPSIKKISP